MRMNNGLFAATLDPYIAEPGYKKVFAAFDGPMPTQEQLEALYTGSDFNLNQLTNFGQGNLRGYFVYGTDLVAIKPKNNMVRWELSKREEPITITELGEVSWFYFAIVEDSVTDINSDVKVFHAYVGSVSDIYEGGDVEIIDKKIGANQNYLVNDLEITFRM